MYEVKRFTIEDVANLHGLHGKFRNGEVFCRCPNCGNEKNKFSYVVCKGEKRDVFHCWSCDVKGNSVDLHILLSGKHFSSHKEAARDIFQSLNGNNDYKEYNKKQLKRREAQEQQPQEPKKGVEYCSKVYFKLLKLLELKKKHKKNLLDRGLSDKDIVAYKFKSMPNKPKAKAICKALSQHFDLEGVPGFFQDDDGTWSMFYAGEGFLCPVYDGRENMILGFQVRLDNPIGKSKYLWFSSYGKPKGASSGAMTCYLPGKGKGAIVIEGILKSLICYCLLKQQVTIIGVPGTKSIHKIGDMLKSSSNLKMCFEAYDMDKEARVVIGEDKTLEDILLYIQRDRVKHHSATDSYEFSFVDDKIQVLKKSGADTLLLKEFVSDLSEEKIKESLAEVKKVMRLSEDADKLKMTISQYMPVRSLKWSLDAENMWNGKYKGLDDYLAEPDNLKKMQIFIEKMVLSV